MILLQKYQSYHMTQQFYTWASTQKKWTCVHTKTCITVQTGALFMAAPNKCSTCSSPDKERIVVYPKGVLQLTRPILDFVLLQRKDCILLRCVCLGRLRLEWKRGGRWAGRGHRARAWLRKLTVACVLGQQQDQWGQRQVGGLPFARLWPAGACSRRSEDSGVVFGCWVPFVCDWIIRAQLSRSVFEDLSL